MNREELYKSMEATFAFCLETARKKNADYAKGDDPFRNFKASEFVGVPVERGMLVRMMDKMARVANSLDQELQVKDETVADTLTDLANYAVILKAYLESKNKGE